jgi:hypothetical protein
VFALRSYFSSELLLLLLLLLLGLALVAVDLSPLLHMLFGENTVSAFKLHPLSCRPVFHRIELMEQTNRITVMHPS